MKFNPPPTWPAPPPGWEPDASWSPDPSWPPPPPGWPLWLADSTDATDDAQRSVRRPATGQGDAAARKGSIVEWGALGAALFTFVAGLLPWWTDSASSMGYTVSASMNAWHRFWWIGPLVAVAVGVADVLVIVKGVAAHPKTLLLVAGGGFASFVLTLISLIDTISLPTGLGVPRDASPGPSVGVFLALITTAAQCYLGALAAQDAGARLPIVIPDPRRGSRFKSP